MTVAEAIARAWRDSEFKDKLVNDTHAALAEAGVAIPADTTVKVVENTADCQHLVLPVAPDNIAELSATEMEKVAGGSGFAGDDAPR